MYGIPRKNLEILLAFKLTRNGTSPPLRSLEFLTFTCTSRSHIHVSLRVDELMLHPEHGDKHLMFSYCFITQLESFSLRVALFDGTQQYSSIDQYPSCVSVVTYILFAKLFGITWYWHALTLA